MTDFANKKNLILQVGHLMIFIQPFRLLKKFIKEKFFGNIISAKVGKVRMKMLHGLLLLMIYQ